MRRLFFNILSGDVAASKDFYVSLFEMKIHFDSDWFVILKPDGETPFELGIIDRSHAIAPKQAAGPVAGIYPTFVVEDVEAVHRRAIAAGLQIVEKPTDMFYGQRRMLVRDPDGLIIDVSSPTPN